MTTYQDAWPVYRRLGWAGTLPLPPGRKSPPPKGFTGRDGIDPSGPDCAELCQDPRYRGTRQMALRMPDVVIGLDVDNYDGRTGAAAIAEGERRWVALPDGPWSSAREDGSGIRFFLVPAGTVLVSEVKFPDLGLGHVEVVQRHHRFAVVWPSRHPDTRTGYTWRGTAGPDVPPAVDDLPPLPAEWLAGLQPPRRPETRATPVGEPATHRALAGVIGFVLAAQPGSRNSSLWWGSCRIWERVAAGQLTSTAAEAMLSDAAAAIRLGDGEARATIASARKAVIGRA